jgi:predicted nucleic acid-binding protein
LIFVDTGAFIARYFKRDQHHAEAIPIWERIEQRKDWLCTSNFVLDELATYLARKSNYLFAAQKIQALYDSEAFDILRPSDEHERLAIRLFAKYADQEVSFTDCISLVLMKVHGIHRAFAFDRHFDIPGFIRIPLEQ